MRVSRYPCHLGNQMGLPDSRSLQRGRLWPRAIPESSSLVSTRPLPRGLSWKLTEWYRISSLPLQAEAEKSIEQLSGEQASKQILASHYAAPEIGVDPSDPLGLKADEKVAVEANDAEPGTHPQYGKLVGLSKRETVLELDNGLRVHFPRVGYVVKKA